MDWAWTLVSADTIGGLVVLHMKFLLCGICFSKGIGGRLVTATCGWLKVYLAEWHGLISTLFIFLYIVWVQSLFQCQCLGLIPELYGTYQLLFTALHSVHSWRCIFSGAWFILCIQLVCVLVTTEARPEFQRISWKERGWKKRFLDGLFIHVLSGIDKEKKNKQTTTASLEINFLNVIFGTAFLVIFCQFFFPAGHTRCKGRCSLSYSRALRG